MTYTDEEYKQIEDAAKEYSLNIKQWVYAENTFKDAFQSLAIQSILESRIKQAKIDLLESALNWSNEVNDTCEYLQHKLNELKK